MKKILASILASSLLITGCMSLTSCDSKTYSIGICQQMQHVALDDATNGFKQALIDELGEENITFDVQNASGDPTTCSTIVQSFISKDVDLILANATYALQAAYNATQTIPILGTSITEYGVALELENFNGTVGGNVSGTSDLAPLNEQADVLLELFPDAKNVGMLYCSAEPNSDYQVKAVSEYLTAKGITCTNFSFSDSNDLPVVAAAAAAASDVIYIPTDNAVATGAEIVGNIVREAKVPVIAGEEGICKACGIATLTISYYDLGYTTGKMAAKILRGEAKISEMPVEYAPAVKKYNAELAAEFGITIPAGYEAIA